MRLIDADALLAKFNKKSDIWTALTDEKTANDFALYCKVADAVEEMPTVGGWISVKDRLPSEYGNYIAFCEGEVMECTYAPPKKGMIPGWSTCDAHGVHFFGEKSVTHWMEMPKPPKEEKDDA